MIDEISVYVRKSLEFCPCDALAQIEAMEGKRVPEVTFKRVEGPLTTADVFAGKTVVVFSLPGAFTPTCSASHVPRYDELADELRARGVDEIVCISVNDAYVMDAWAKEQGTKNVLYLPDGNGEFTRGMGQLVDRSDVGFGPRSWRYSMLVRDGVVEKMFVEPHEPGDPYEVSDADTMLRWLDPAGKRTPDILLLTRPRCSHCAHARSLLEARNLPYVEMTASPRMLRAVAKTPTTPQIFVDGEHIGGADDLERHLGR
jgi:peroxiredoxin/glutaredoxin